MSKVAKPGNDVASLVKKGDYEGLKEFLDRITNRIEKVTQVNTPSASGSTPLFTSAWDGRVDICELLLENGAKVNWKNLRGNTALSMAIEQNHVEIVQLFLQWGGHGETKEVQEIRLKTGKKISPKIDQLITNAKILQELDSKENKEASVASDLGQAVLAGRTADVLDLLKNKQTVALINETDSDGQTVLFAAAAHGYLEICKALIQSGIDINFRDKNGKSALHMAIAGNQYQTTKLLLEQGANTTGVDMRQIRYWAMGNISQRIDNLLKKYPPAPLKPSKAKKSPIEGLTLKEFQLQKQIFQFFDINNDGFISEAELQQRLKQTTRGPAFDETLIKQMIKVANSYNHSKGVSFEQFVEILQPMRGLSAFMGNSTQNSGDKWGNINQRRRNSLDI